MKSEGLRGRILERKKGLFVDFEGKPLYNEETDGRMQKQDPLSQAAEAEKNPA